MATSTTVNSGGIQSVYGSASGTTIYANSYQVVFSGGVASGTTVNSGGNEVDHRLSGGSDVSATVSSGGSQLVAGVANGDTIYSGGFQEITGVATGTIIGNSMLVTPAAVWQAGAIVSSGRTETIWGSDVSATVYAGGLQEVQGSASGAT